VAFLYVEASQTMHLPKNFQAQAIIFDKDGTLIDFDTMWGAWTLQLAERFQAATGRDICQALCECYGYDLARRRILPDGKLTFMPMWRLRELMVEVVASLAVPEAADKVRAAWHVPDPVALAKPFTDIQKLFTQLHKRDIKIALATADDRDPTQAMLSAFGVTDLVAAMVCADDGIPTKPAPDMVTKLC
jgi:phosphoglycolate phosphatase-like HAD superfamily hydrolase